MTLRETVHEQHLQTNRRRIGFAIRFASCFSNRSLDEVPPQWQGVATPVEIRVVDGKAYFHTWSSSGKIK
jgi:hypothetical protein